MKIQHSMAAAIAIAAASGAALAGTASVDVLGGEVNMRSNSVAGVFSTASPVFSSSDLAALHTELNGDGISTDGLVTSMLLDTANGSLAWVVLVDREDPMTLGSTPSSLEMSTTANASHMEFINDSGSDIGMVFSPGSSQTAVGFFNWDASGEGDAFAWDKLLTGDTFSFDFFEDTGDDPTNIDGFQFVSWNQGLGAWEVVDTGDFTQTNPGNPPQFSYTVRVLIPAPQAALLGFAGIGGVGIIRRRKLG